jgi:predicted nucleic acid-binding protein
MPDRVVISNTSPLVYLHQIGQIGLLRSLYGQVIVPQAVQDELRAGEEIGFDVPELAKTPWMEVQPLVDRTLLPAVVDLGLGEA